MSKRRQNAKKCVARNCNKRIGNQGTKKLAFGLCNTHAMDDRRVKMKKVGCMVIGCTGMANLSGYCQTHEPRDSPVARPELADDDKWKGFEVRQVNCLYCGEETKHDFACLSCREKITEGLDV